jgi:gliding motility-associated-like protein
LLQQRIISVLCILGLFAGASWGQSTIPPILLCSTTDINGDVTLTWEPSAEACGPFVEYNIYAATNLAGPYSLLASLAGVGTSSYLHIGADGAVTTWYYYVEAVYNCAGYTITLSDTLDNLDPVAPNLVDVTVVVGGQVKITWEVSPSPETTSYIIYRDMGGFTPIDTVYGRFTTTVTDATAIPAEQVETYTIAARDSCGTIGPFNNNSHHTIKLDVEWQNCTDTITLLWNAYDTWAEGVDRYEIWLDDDGSGAALIDVLPPSASTYIYSGPEFADGYIYAFIVRAVRADEATFSDSNTRGFEVVSNQPSQYNYIRNATVNLNNTISLEWYPDVNADIQNYTVQRSTDGVDYLNIGNTNFAGGVPTIYYFTDNGVNTREQFYYYQTEAADACGLSLTSGTARTMHLTGEDNANLTNNINWTPFEIANGEVIEYRIYRNPGNGDPEVLIATNTPDHTGYLDNVIENIEDVQQFCYRVQAIFQLTVEEIGVNLQLNSYSNELCLEQGPRIYVPNAIVPDGVNNMFIPYIIFGKQDGYTMQIFNRYGKQIFESTSVDVGWDGTIDGEPVPMGTYGYLITFTATNNQVITKKGNVTVIR